MFGTIHYLTYIILSSGVFFIKYGVHKPAETSPVVLGLTFSVKIVIDTVDPNFSCIATAVVKPITPAPITATLDMFVMLYVV